MLRAPSVPNGIFSHLAENHSRIRLSLIQTWFYRAFPARLNLNQKFSVKSSARSSIMSRESIPDYFEIQKQDFYQ